MLDCRSEVVERFWNGGLALMFRLPRRRYIVGYSLGDDGMLFRGELIDNCDEDEARHHCLMVSANWMELDAEDEQAELECQSGIQMQPLIGVSKPAREWVNDPPNRYV